MSVYNRDKRVVTYKAIMDTVVTASATIRKGANEWQRIIIWTVPKSIPVQREYRERWNPNFQCKK